MPYFCQKLKPSKENLIYVTHKKQRKKIKKEEKMSLTYIVLSSKIFKILFSIKN